MFSAAETGFCHHPEFRPSQIVATPASATYSQYKTWQLDWQKLEFCSDGKVLSAINAFHHFIDDQFKPGTRTG
ncbi:hypothetical protein [Methylobacterium segetis]|uniref:hypothetical protein n=1 Tax=Methylobacterium segetis TaxID=2488750 RepID=UPI00104D7170|nr:hypothetical protein [Methylobacterium segetis]